MPIPSALLTCTKLGSKQIFAYHFHILRVTYFINTSAKVQIQAHLIAAALLCLEKKHTLKKTQKSLCEVPIWETHIIWTFGLSLCQKTQKKSFLRKEVKTAYLGKWIWRWRYGWTILCLKFLWLTFSAVYGSKYSKFLK